MQIRFGFTLLGESSVLGLSVFTSLQRRDVWEGGNIVRSPPGVVQHMSPTGDAWARLFRYFYPALKQEETVTKASGTWQSPAELKRLCLKPQ